MTKKNSWLKSGKLTENTALAWNPVARHGGEQLEAAADFVPVVLLRVFDGFPDIGLRAEMKDGVERLPAEHFVECFCDVPPGQIRAHDLAAARRGDMALAEVVENDDALVALEKLPYRVGADIAGASGDEERRHVSDAPLRNK